MLMRKADSMAVAIADTRSQFFEGWNELMLEEPAGHDASSWTDFFDHLRQLVRADMKSGARGPAERLQYERTGGADHFACR